MTRHMETTRGTPNLRTNLPQPSVHHPGGPVAAEDRGDPSRSEGSLDLDANAAIVPWHCPRCRCMLEADSTQRGLHCQECAKVYPVRNGIPDFIDMKTDAFYETKGEVFHFPKLVPRSLPFRTRLAMIFADDDFSGNLTFLRRVMRQPGIVLDIACGGGTSFYPAYVGPTVGIDLALTSVLRARAVYPQVARARVEALPFCDNAFDYVVSTDFLEHVPLEIKDKTIAEIARVLKPGGRMAHVSPVDNRHFLMQWAKRFPQLYARQFIAQDGHDGFETASAVLGRLDQAGLRRLCVRVQRGIVWSKWEITKRFGEGFVEQALWMRCLVSVCRFCGRFRLLNHAVNVPLTLLDRVLTPMFGLDYAYRAGVCYEKPG